MERRNGGKNRREWKGGMGETKQAGTLGNKLSHKEKRKKWK